MFISISICTTLMAIYAIYEYYHHRKFIKEIKHQTEYWTTRLDAIRDEYNSCDKELMYLIGYIDGQLGDSCNPHMTNKQFNERISIMLSAYEECRKEATKEATKDANDIIDKLEKGLL